MPAARKFDAHKSRHDPRSQETLAKTIVILPEDPQDNRIFVTPAWAVTKPAKRRGITRLVERLMESRMVEALKIELKALLFIVVLGGIMILLFASLRGFYRTKSEAGVDLTPFHGPNLVPFIR